MKTEDVRAVYFVSGLDIGALVQQKRHGVRLTILTGPHQGCPPMLQREGVHAWFCMARIRKSRAGEGIKTVI
jgi:hypothetical protein